MREIKFRAWHEEAKEMLNEDNTGDVFRWLNDGQPIVIEQFTGLHDKNGKEIYEGDILSNCMINPTYYIIEFNKTHAKYRGRPIGKWLTYLDAISYESHKLVGNIHENQELINER